MAYPSGLTLYNWSLKLQDWQWQWDPDPPDVELPQAEALAEVCEAAVEAWVAADLAELTPLLEDAFAGPIDAPAVEPVPGPSAQENDAPPPASRPQAVRSVIREGHWVLIAERTVWFTGYLQNPTHELLRHVQHEDHVDSERLSSEARRRSSRGAVAEAGQTDAEPGARGLTGPGLGSGGAPTGRQAQVRAHRVGGPMHLPQEEGQPDRQ